MTREQEQFILNLWDGLSSEDIRRQFNERFGTSYKTTAFHYHTKKLGLSKWTPHRYTKEQDEFLKKNAGRMSREQLTDEFNLLYGTHIKQQAIEQRCFLNGWKPQSDGKFKIGGVPWGKSKGGREEFVKKLQGGNTGSFKKGNIPANTLKVGSVKRWGHNVVIKTEKGCKNRLRYMWEQAHGDIPGGYVVISVDGDQYTNDINNLRAISNHALTVLIANRWNGKGSDIVDTGIVWHKLRMALGNSKMED